MRNECRVRSVDLITESRSKANSVVWQSKKRLLNASITGRWAARRRCRRRRGWSSLWPASSAPPSSSCAGRRWRRLLPRLHSTIFLQNFETIREVFVKLLSCEYFPTGRAEFSLILRAELCSATAHVGQVASRPARYSNQFSVCASWGGGVAAVMLASMLKLAAVGGKLLDCWCLFFGGGSGRLGRRFSVISGGGWFFFGGCNVFFGFGSFKSGGGSFFASVTGDLAVGSSGVFFG